MLHIYYLKCARSPPNLSVSPVLAVRGTHPKARPKNTDIRVALGTPIAERPPPAQNRTCPIKAYGVSIGRT